MKYSIGDKVRFVNENMDGVVSSVIDANNVGVTVDDFEIPVPVNQIVKIAFEEYLKTEAAVATTEVKNAEKGFDENIYASFVQFDDQQLELYFVNHTRYRVFVNYYTKHGDTLTPKYFGTIEAYDYRGLDKLLLSRFADWEEFVFQVILKPETTEQMPVVKYLKVPANKFFKHLRATPLLHKQGYLFLINNGLNEEDLNKLAAFDSQVEKRAESITGFKAPLEIIDLHIDKLHNNYTQLTKQETFQIQVDYFHRNLENAIATGMKKVTFIHGVGTMKLKNEIHKSLQSNTHIDRYEEAPVNEFGYGATLVFLKD